MTAAVDIREHLAQRLHNTLARLGPGPAPSITEFLRAASNVGPLDHYKHFPADCHRLAAAVGASEGSQAQRLFLDAVLLAAMEETIDSGRLAALPTRSKAHQSAQFNRLLWREDPLPSWLDMASDLFHKEFGLAALRLHAGAAQLIDPRCGIPRSLFLKSGASGIARGLQVLLECGGLSPMLQIHTHTAYLDEFSDEGWRECYRVCVELFGLYPSVKGMFGGSWFYDPAVSQISPRLAYLSDVPKQGGAKFFLAAKSGDFAHDAISTSPSRRKLFDEGRYKPASYMMIWSKNAQIYWARQNSVIAL